jgi:hypothetical protein
MRFFDFRVLTLVSYMVVAENFVEPQPSQLGMGKAFQKPL